MNLVATREERGVHLRIARPGLAERVNRALDSGSIVLTAGAGCGKTIAIEQALAHRPAPHLWLRCRPTDSDPGTLLRRLVQLLSEVAPGAVDLLAQRLAMAQERIDTRGAAQELVEELDRLLPAQIVVAFDDAEALAESPGATSLVGDLIAADFPVVRVAVATGSRSRFASPSSGRAAASRSWVPVTSRSPRRNAPSSWRRPAGPTPTRTPSSPPRRDGRSEPRSAWPTRTCRRSQARRRGRTSSVPGRGGARSAAGRAASPGRGLEHHPRAGCGMRAGARHAGGLRRPARAGRPAGQDRRRGVAMARIPPTGAGVPARPAQAGPHAGRAA